MSQAEELLNGLSGNEPTVYTVEPDTEPHIVVNADRTITVPDELKHIAVQRDHNIETVTFDCPRFWDEHDFSTMKVYVVYRRPDGYVDRYPVKNLRIDDGDTKMIHFEWTISRNVTPIKGNISFIICINKVDDEAIETNHWNSRLNQDLVIDEGLECSTNEIVEPNPDIIESILLRLSIVEQGGVSDERIAQAVSDYLAKNPSIFGSTLRVSEITLLAANWTGEANLYSQVVNIDGVTKNSQVDLTPSIEQLAIFYDKDLAFVTENEDGVVTVYVLGDKPSNDYTMQVTIKEVNV